MKFRIKIKSHPFCLRFLKICLPMNAVSPWNEVVAGRKILTNPGNVTVKFSLDAL